MDFFAGSNIEFKIFLNKSRFVDKNIKGCNQREECVNSSEKLSKAEETVL